MAVLNFVPTELSSLFRGTALGIFLCSAISHYEWAPELPFIVAFAFLLLGFAIPRDRWLFRNDARAAE